MPTEVIARGLLIMHGRVLLCRNLGKNYFYLPGGHVEFGEPAAAALEREFLEETGRVVRAGACVLVSEHAFTQGKRPRHELNLVFHVEHVAPEVTAKGRRSTRPATPRKSKPGSKGKVFHVEHDLPRFQSLEKDIGFEWVDLAAIVDLDLRPVMVRAWLSSGGVVRAPSVAADVPPLAWYSDIARGDL